uniref:F-box domain-containing protein n=1 Tax=Aotus nancymaae TaxID=37293 RepID=A0A2K5CD07_AOTNA
MHRKHLQQIPDLSSNIAASFTWGWDSRKTSELLSGMGVSALKKEEPNSKNIPQELKRLKSKGSDKDFVIIRRPKLNRENFPAVLRIFSCLCLPELLKVSGVCKRWYHLAFDESLWQTLDLTGKNLHPDVTGQLLSQEVIAFSCPRSFTDQPLAEHFSPFRVQHMYPSISVIEVSTLQDILSQCSKLQNLSLEGLRLSDPIVNNLSQTSNLVRLNLFEGSGFSEFALQTLLSGCSRLDELNLSWCFDFTEQHVQVAAVHVSETIAQLNLSCYRKNLQKSDLSTLVRRCPNLVHLDLNDCFPEFFQLNYLQHLSLKIPTLRTLQAFGIVPDSTLQLLKELPHGIHLKTYKRPNITKTRSIELTAF